MMIRMWRLVALPVFLGFLFLGGYLYFYLGGYKEVQVQTKELPPMKLLYSIHRGPYHQINEVITQVEKWAKENNIDCSRSFGEYLDDPKTTAEHQLKSYGGCVLTADTQLPTQLPQGFETRLVPSAAYVYAEFTGSPAIGPFKVYPKLDEYIRKQSVAAATSVIEIYQVISDREMRTEYLKSLSQSPAAQ